MRFTNTILAVAAIATVTFAADCDVEAKCNNEGALTCGELLTAGGKGATAVFKCVDGCWAPQAPYCLELEICVSNPAPHCEGRPYRKWDA